MSAAQRCRFRMPASAGAPFATREGRATSIACHAGADVSAWPGASSAVGEGRR